VPTASPFHVRTLSLCQPLEFRDWSGFYAATSYDITHEHEYNAIRQAAALIDVSPLYKYRVSGRDACRLLDRILTRSVPRLKVGQVGYTSWCDGRGKVIDDGTVSRLADDVYRWTAAEPNLRWAEMNAAGLDVVVEDASESTAALALQGPTSRALLEACAEADVAGLRYFRVTAGSIGGVPVQISRTGYTGDLGYEIWMPAERALDVWDALTSGGRAYGVTPAGLNALDVARIEAGLILIGVDYVPARRALIASEEYTPFELGLGRLVHLDKAPFVGQQALAAEAQTGPSRCLVGLEVDWQEFEALHEARGLPPRVPATASRASVPVYRDASQVGKVTSTTWSPVLKKLIALGSVAAPAATIGTRLRMEVTIDHRREQVGASVVPLPFYDPPQKRG
jgi:aminomethyltransferase